MLVGSGWQCKPRSGFKREAPGLTEDGLRTPTGQWTCRGTDWGKAKRKTSEQGKAAYAFGARCLLPFDGKDCFTPLADGIYCPK